VLNRFLMTPESPRALISEERVYSTGLTALPSLTIQGLGWLAGVGCARALGLVLGVVASLSLGTEFASLANARDLVPRGQHSLIATGFLVLPPAFFSATLIALQLLPGWHHPVAADNPVNWAVQVARQSLSQLPNWSKVEPHLGLLAVLWAWLSTRAFRAYQRSVQSTFQWRRARPHDHF